MIDHEHWDGQAGTEQLEPGWFMRLADVFTYLRGSLWVWESTHSVSEWFFALHPISPVPAGGTGMGYIVQRHRPLLVWDQWLREIANWVSFLPEEQLCPWSCYNRPEASAKDSEYTYKQTTWLSLAVQREEKPLLTLQFLGSHFILGGSASFLPFCINNCYFQSKAQVLPFWPLEFSPASHPCPN